MTRHWALDNEQRATLAFRLLLDAWADGEAAYWERRARELEAARPSRSDWFPPGYTAQNYADAWNRLNDAAAACRARGSLAELSRANATDTLADLASGAAA